MLTWCMLALLLPALSAAGPVLLLPQDCQEVFRSGVNESGVYTIYPSESTPVDVYCEMSCSRDDKEYHGWTVILRRMDGSVGFNLPWQRYQNGFGDKNGEYWLGLNHLYQMTHNKVYELQVDLEDFDGQKASAAYKTFIVGPESDDYTLRVGDFVNYGAGDSLSYQSGQKFSTYDNENNYNCAVLYQGGFWYSNCFFASPCGLYLGSPYSYYYPYNYYYYYYYSPGVIWASWRGWSYSLKGFTMKIRPLS